MLKVKDYTSEEQLELYKAMLKAQPQSMFLMDRDKNIIGIFNAAPETLAGYTVDDIIGNSILKFANDPTSPFYEACSMLNSTFDPVFQTGTTLKFQYMILDNHFEATISKISGDRILSQVRDITDTILKIKDIEEKNHNELSVALLAGGVTSWTYDVEKKIISSTHENNVINESLFLDDFMLLILPEHRQTVTQMFDDIISGECSHGHIEVQVVNQEGNIQWSEVHAVPHEFSADGQISFIIGSQKNVTEERAHSEKLNRLNKQNELILDNTHSGFAYLTPDLNIEWENVSRVFPNLESSKLFQISLPPDQSVSYCTPAIKKAMETKKQAICSFKTDNNSIFESIAQPVLTTEGELEGIVIRIDDITEKEQFVHELAKAKETAEQSDKLKSAFLANMSHEIRTPLNSIVGFSQLLPEIEDKEEQTSYINIINANSQTLLNLINDILDLSKIEAGYFTCNNEEFDLSDLFKQLSITFKGRARTDVEFLCEIPEDHFFVKLDRTRVLQVISNFVTNAIKFTHKGYVKMGYIPMDNYIKLYVEDTGCGMTKDQVEHVFERFEKFNSFEQGTGLGTSIVKAIVDAYNGNIGVESCFEKGSTFWAILPTHQD